EEELIQSAKKLPEAWQNLGYHELNAILNLYGPDGEIQFEADHAAARQYFLQHVNKNTVFFHTRREQIDYLIENDYYEPDTFDQYPEQFVFDLYDQAYAHKFQFPSLLLAFKFSTPYALKTFDGERSLERYEDRVVMHTLLLARENQDMARRLVDAIIFGRFQPATPRFLNAGKKQRGELV